MSLLHQIALTFIKGVGPVTARQLLDHYGSAEAIFAAEGGSLRQLPGLRLPGAIAVHFAAALQEAEKQLELLKGSDTRLLFFSDENYPKRLRECSDAPVVLYYKGNANLNHKRIISIVGTRKATPYGRMLCRQLAEHLEPYDVVIVSGLAYGIDITAHKESLNHHIPTIGVLGHGFDRLYPPVHKTTALEMISCGGLLTEFPVNSVLDQSNFPKRNRIIAGISDATIVVEAALKGGALITADLAGSYFKDVFAFPGRSTDEFSQGCNYLIKANKAALISDPIDLIDHLGWERAKVKEENSSAGLFKTAQLCAEELKVVHLLEDMSMGVDEIAFKSGIVQSQLAIVLLNLEMKGFLMSLPGKIYKLLKT
ncbi:DNA-processing protein DprA [Pedobacter nutrimenti]|uniref:DNA processing protein n=1 Tax=Pedobacter nutrimenti TaxID=1241337 RepID=A0A318U6G0_9SPHI|nr:DNA-processing protein DprA [Pedobacter nutrimenti]PYF68945.1 DNA processing protein [Pedobacter nutrimenti]